MFRSHYLFAAMVLVALAGSAGAAKNDSNANTKADDASGVRVTEVRNWSLIDTNRDGYVEADEMENYLKQYWAQKGNSQAAVSSNGENGAAKK